MGLAIFTLVVFWPLLTFIGCVPVAFALGDGR